MSFPETSREEIAAAIVQRLDQRKRGVFRRMGTAACRDHVDGLLDALTRDLASGTSDALRGAVQRMFDTLVDEGVTLLDIRQFAQSVRASVRDAYGEVPADVLTIEDWLAELVLVCTMRFVVDRERQIQHQSMEREVLRVESRLIELQTTLNEKNRLLDEVQQLNDELRRQITQRSNRLMDALLASNLTARVQGELPPGALFSKVYRVKSKIGEGGMGAVYEVERTTDGVSLAAKVIKCGADRKRIARFVREAQLLARLTHPHLVTIYDVDFDSGVLYIVMELAAGTLCDHSERVGQVDWWLEVFGQVCAALTLLHEQSIVHRDLKPGNILVMSKDPSEGVRIKVADFGIAIALEDSQSPVEPPTPAANADATLLDESEPNSLFTGTGVLLGTPGYMAPELARGSHHATAASDMFSLGVIAFELLLGSSPFPHPPVFSLHAPSSPVFDGCPGLPSELAQLFARCLDWDPRARPSAAELARALSPNGSHSGASGVSEGALASIP